uniref:Uncharacterized protein n=1 Tax=Pygocentrus nattereri TaxID=42514 RepID=A0AAR2JZF5_PYGNA
MPETSLVIIRYGPYKSCGVVDHRTFRLDGLQAVLKDCGHSYVLEKIPDWNQVELVVNGECIYKCNINDLEFGNNSSFSEIYYRDLLNIRNSL